MTDAPTGLKDAAEGRQSTPAARELADSVGRGFFQELASTLAANIRGGRSATVDIYRFPDRTRDTSRRSLRNRLRTWLCGRGAVSVAALGRDAVAMADRLDALAAHSPGIGTLYDSLADERSRSLLCEVLAFRVLGPAHARLPLDTSAHWQRVGDILERQLVQGQTHRIPLLDGWLHLFDLNAFGVPAKVHAHLLNIVNTFALEQYRYRSGRTEVAVEPGDCVIDGGACWGDTSVYFANRCGGNGRVIAFEFEPANLAILEENLALAGPLSERILIERSPLWNRSGVEVAFDSVGPGTRVSAAGGSAETRARTRSIDEFVASTGLPSVDFLKLDVEGAELRALQGAESVLRNHRPKLAVALYHSLEDFAAIPEYIRSLGLGYELYFDHFTTHDEESVLFARSTK